MKKINMFFGKVNVLLKDFIIEGFIDRIINNRGILYKVIEKGMKFLEENIVYVKSIRLKFYEEEKKIVR